MSIQYGIKHLVDVVSAGPEKAVGLWQAFAILCGLIAADNLLWRVGGWVGRAYVRGGDRRHAARPVQSSDRPLADLLLRATAGHARQPDHGDRRTRSTPTENTCSWNVLPPCIAVIGAIVMIGIGEPDDGRGADGGSAGWVSLVFYLARRGTPLHRSFAAKAASVDGELVDVIGNMPVVRAFGITFAGAAALRRHHRCRDGRAQQSLLYLEKLRLLHARDHARCCRRPGSAGRSGCGAAARRRRATSCSSARSVHDPARHARSGRGARRRDAACRAAGGSGRRAAEPHGMPEPRRRTRAARGRRSISKGVVRLSAPRADSRATST